MSIIEKIKDEIFSFYGFIFLVGATGSIFGLLRNFIDVESDISIKWLLLVLNLAVFIILTFIKVLVNTNHQLEMALTQKMNVISILIKENILLVEFNRILAANATVSLFLIKSECEIFVASAYVYHVQNDKIQIKLLDYDKDFAERNPDDFDMIKNGNSNITKNLIIKNIVIHNRS